MATHTRSALFGIAVFLSAGAAIGQSTDTPELLPGESVVRVHSKATIERMPDVFGIAVTVESVGQTPRQAAAQNQTKVDALLKILNSAGIGEVSTELEEYSASAVYEVDDRQRTRPIGYEANQQISVEIAQFDQMEPLVDRLTEAGFSDLRVSFGMKLRRPLELEARRLAIQRAREEAQNIAGGLGKRVGRLLLVGTDLDRYRGNEASDSIIVTGSRVPRNMIRPAPVEIESEIYADWSLVDE